VNPMPAGVIEALARRWPRVMNDPAGFRLQFLASCGGEKLGFRADAEYFYPASSVKACSALAALTLFPLEEVERDVTLLSVVSDNPAYNRLFDRVGLHRLNTMMRAAGLGSVRLTHHLGVPGAVRHDLGDGPLDVPGLDVGVARIEGGVRIEGGLACAGRNRIALADLHAMIGMIAERRGFELSATAWNMLQRVMTCDPASAGFVGLPRHHVKFFGPGVERVAENATILSKCGRAYGFTIDNAVIRAAGKPDVRLTACVYTNANGVLNDDVYEYDTIASPLFADLAEAVVRRFWA
jgi:hypothetical protein